jgi:hypothetical protein
VDQKCHYSARRIGRRAAIELGLCLALSPRFALAQTDAARDRPKEGDLLIDVTAAAAPEPLKPDDLPLGGKQTLAWPMDPETKTLRNGSRHTGQKAWGHPFANSQLWGPVLATAGGVLFAGGTNDRYFRAFDASNGKILWEFRTGSGVNGVPVSFQIDGKQYVAVQSGWGVDAARMQARLNLVRPWEFPDVPQGGSVWVFALD